MKLYITKWALTAGIIEVDSEDFTLNQSLYLNSSYWYGRYTPESLPMSFYVNKDIFERIEDAKIKAVSMQKKKIESLKKQIKKLESKTF